MVENVDLNGITDLSELHLPNEQILEFRSGQFGTVGADFFEMISESVQVTFKRGFLREILFWSPSVVKLRVLSTDLTLFDVLGEPNYSLTSLAVRSPTFSRLSDSMMWLKSLEIIDFAGCNFTVFNLDLIEGTKLRVLKLSRNKLQTLSSFACSRLTTLKELYLEGNQLHYLWRFPDIAPHLQIISINNNRWLCDFVEMARFASALRQITIVRVDLGCEKGLTHKLGICCHEVLPGVNEIAAVATDAHTTVLDNSSHESGNETEITGAHSNSTTVYLDEALPIP